MSTEIDRLIEDGLDRYGSGDLDGALLAWERALAIDPDNATANSYVDYVRQNYELLAEGSVRTDPGEDAPFAISEEPEYHIEIVKGIEPPERPSQPPMQAEQVDTGWFIEEATHEMPPHAQPEPTDPGGPPALPAFELDQPEPVSFEEQTTEYSSRGFKVPELAKDSLEPSSSGEFESEGTPVGFSHQVTGVKPRDLGFVTPRADTQPGPAIAARVPGKKTNAPPIAEQAPSDSGRMRTRDLPQPSRAPAARDPSAVSQAEVLLPHAETVELDRGKALKAMRDEPAVSAPTRDLGLRPPAAPGRPATRPGIDEEAPTRESDARAIREHASTGQRGGSSRPLTESTRHDISLPFDPIDAQAAQILDDIDAGAPLSEPDDDRSRRRITQLFERAIGYHEAGEAEKAVLAIDLALEEDPTSALAQKLIHRNRDAATQVFQAYLGDLERQPALAKPLHELAAAPISPRAAFLLSRIDGMLTVDEILDVSGMPRLEAYRYLCQLFLRGILK